MRHDRLYLLDIIAAADDLELIIAGLDFTTFASVDVVRSAALWKLTVIGEATAHVSDDIRGRYPRIPWSSIVGFRNIVVHEYFGIDWEIVWEAATRSVPILRDQIQAILTVEFPEAR